MQDRLENAHKTVRANTQQAMVRQKHYHDKKLNWGQFKENDGVYVYFPSTKSGQSPKFTSYWRGPYRIIRKMSDVTYKVNCGQRESTQVIHVDRIRLKRPQTLVGETADGIEEQNEETLQEQAHTCSDNIKAERENKNCKSESVVNDQHKYKLSNNLVKKKNCLQYSFEVEDPLYG